MVIFCSEQEIWGMWSTQRRGSGRTFVLFLQFGVESLCGLKNQGAVVTLSSYFHKKVTFFILEL